MSSVMPNGAQTSPAGNGHVLTFHETLRGFSLMALTPTANAVLEKFTLGFNKGIWETGKHTNASAVVENGEKLLVKYGLLSDENIALMEKDLQPPAREAQAAIKRNCLAIKNGGKFEQIKALVSTTEQQVDVARQVFTNDLKMVAVPQWLNRADRVALVNELALQASLDFKDPMLQHKIRSNFFSHGCRSVTRTIPDDMKSKATLVSDKWIPPENLIIPDDQDLHVWRNPPELPIHQLMLLGLPGIGKSDIKKLAKLMETPVISLDIPALINGGLDSRKSAKWNLWDQTEFRTKDNLVHGELIQKMLRAGRKNNIAMIDEPNFDDIGGVKKLLDIWQAKDNFSECTGVSTKTEHFTIITTNTVPTMSVPEVLKIQDLAHTMNPEVLSRVNLGLPGESEETKIARDATRAYIRLAHLVCLPHADTNETELDPVEQQQMQRVFKAVLPTIVDWHGKKFGALRTDPIMETMVGEIAIAMITGQLPKTSVNQEAVALPPLDMPPGDRYDATLARRQELLNEHFGNWVADFYRPMRTYNPYQIEREKTAEDARKAAGKTAEEFTSEVKGLLAGLPDGTKLSGRQIAELMAELKKHQAVLDPARHTIASLNRHSQIARGKIPIVVNSGTSSKG